MRQNTKAVYVGNVQIGGSNDVIIQSMTSLNTSDVENTVKQILELEKAGCQIVRVTVQNMSDAIAIKEIKKQINIPLVADIHFNYKLALVAIENGIDKIRINPGNIGSKENVQKVVEACKIKKIPIRIGVNAGSLEKHLLEEYGYPTAEAMVKSALYHINILEELDFYDIIVSLKASNVKLTVEAYELAAKSFNYPLHLGVTEAGTKFSGSIKSAVGLGILLNQGIGSTIRVSLSDNPVEEIKVAKEILKQFGLISNMPTLISCPTCGRNRIDLIAYAKEIEEFLETIPYKITVAILGCAVNGPGEAREADIGIAGGANEGLLFKKGEIIKKVPENELIQVLKEEIILMTKEIELTKK